MFRLGALFLTLLMSACTTQMWQAPTFEEKILGYYGAKQDKKLIVEGQKYSYIFDATEQVIAVINESRNTAFDPYYTDFKIDENNQVTGQFQLIARGNPDKEKLRAMGFFENKYKNMVIEVALQGKVYQLEGEIPLQKLTKDHYVLVQTPESGVATVGKLVATPVTLTYDAGMVIPVATMFAFIGILNQIDR
ncbi:hypothetical protein LP316_00360 [Thalassotalea sp. LPB0316]|uniref:hypothetical protein n=1 Tax=Thalassotalea sp. LPB0316 TaxID=2769490 RepID=UPI00186935F4|nr:hypothetical protein [Thalassotalea sp. LPB0316]QOL25813.1 hypothetical protein LP316_00360 [Thalassotalea sp. LPB0316]